MNRFSINPSLPSVTLSSSKGGRSRNGAMTAMAMLRQAQHDDVCGAPSWR